MISKILSSPILLFLFATPLLVFVAVLPVALADNYLTALALFPYQPLVFPALQGMYYFIALALAQSMTYGLILHQAKRKRLLFLFSIFVLASHGVAVAYAFKDPKAVAGFPLGIKSDEAAQE